MTFPALDSPDVAHDVPRNTGIGGVDGPIAVVLILMLMAGVAWIVTVPWMWSRDLAESARSRVHVGMRRQDAARELRAAEGFWRQADCGRLNLFYYGTPTMAATGVVVLRFEDLSRIYQATNA